MSSKDDDGEDQGIWHHWPDTCGSGEVISIQLAPSRPRRPRRLWYEAAVRCARLEKRERHFEES